MENLTLLIPAKHESESLPKVLEDLKNLNCKILVVLEENDIETINSIKNFNCEIYFQEGKGYGNALKSGINKIKTKYLCIFNADGSFEKQILKKMLNLLTIENASFIYGSRYSLGGKSDDDTFLTYIGNKIFSLIGRIFFNLKVDDILYTHVFGYTDAFKKLKIQSNDFCFCVELPIKMVKNGYKYFNIGTHEKKRISGQKKVNEFKDGFLILCYMIKSFFKLS